MTNMFFIFHFNSAPGSKSLCREFQFLLCVFLAFSALSKSTSYTSVGWTLTSSKPQALLRNEKLDIQKEVAQNDYWHFIPKNIILPFCNALEIKLSRAFGSFMWIWQYRSEVWLSLTENGTIEHKLHLQPKVACVH